MDEVVWLYVEEKSGAHSQLPQDEYERIHKDLRLRGSVSFLYQATAE